MSFRCQQLAASQATEPFPRLFSKVFGRLFGQVLRTRTTVETGWPNEIPNTRDMAKRRFDERTLATPPPANVMEQLVR